MHLKLQSIVAIAPAPGAVLLGAIAVFLSRNATIAVLSLLREGSRPEGGKEVSVKHS